MSNHIDRKKQIREKNLFDEGTPEEDKRQKAVEKNVRSIRGSVMENKDKRTGRKDATVTAKQAAPKSTEKKRGKKNARQRQEASRFYVCAVMAVFVVFAAGWGICQLVRTINLGEEQQNMIMQPGEQVVDNSANAGKTIDVDKLVTRVLDNVTFEAELNPLEDSVAFGMIDTAEGTDLRIYMGNGTYSDELVVMTALSEADAEQNQKSAETHLSEMQKQFNDYIPKEAKKIDSAVRVRCGCYVVVCVTNDTETAKKTIDTFVKNEVGNER